MNCESIIYKNIVYELKLDKNLNTTFNKWLKKYNISFDEFLSENNYQHTYCHFCNNTINIEKNYKISIVDNKFVINPKWLYLCNRVDCESNKLNAQSKLFIKYANGYTDEEVHNVLIAKGQKTGRTLIENGFFDDKSNNPFSREFWYKRGLDKEEVDDKMFAKANKMVNTKRDSGFYDDISNNPYSKEYWIKKGMTISEAQVKVNSKNWACEEFDNAEEYKDIRGRSISVDFGIKRLGLSEADAILRMSKIKKNLSTSWNPNSLIGNSHSSKTANIVFKKVYKFLRKHGINRKDIYFGLSKYGEFFINSKEHRIMFYDFVVKSLKICVEYHGTHVHPNPLMSKEQKKTWKNVYTKNGYIFHRRSDIIKKQKIQALGYTTLEVWSDNKDIYGTIINFLQEHLK